MKNEKSGVITTFWEVWTNDLPGNFPKARIITMLCNRWGITEANVYKRLKQDYFKSLSSDVHFLYSICGIGFNHKTGFFIDYDRLNDINNGDSKFNNYSLSNSVTA